MLYRMLYAPLGHFQEPERLYPLVIMIVYSTDLASVSSVKLEYTRVRILVQPEIRDEQGKSSCRTSSGIAKC